MQTAHSLLHSLAFQAPPELHPELGNRSVALNSTLILKCIKNGDHPLQINWTKDGVDLGSRNKNIYSVKHVTLNDTGLYGCTVANWAGEAQTNFWIDVTGKAYDF